MRASRLGEHLLMQAISTWNEREIEYTTKTAGIYWLANMLRNDQMKNKRVPINRDSATLRQIATALRKIPKKRIPADYKGIFIAGLKVLDDRGSNEILEIDLKKKFPDQPFPDPLQ